MIRVTTLATGTLMLTLAACAVGPDFEHPSAPGNARYTPAAGPATAPAATPAFDSADLAVAPLAFQDGAPTARWWQAYGSATLDAWVEEGLTRNPDLLSSSAALASARELLAAQVGESELPSIGADAQYSHQRAIGLPSFGPPTSIYKVYAAVVNVSYDVDLFGGVRRANEATRAQVESQGYEWRAAREALAANIVVRALRSAALKEELGADQRLVALAREQQDLTEKLYRLGGAPHRDVIDAERAYHDAAAGLPALRAAWWRERHALAVLMGRTPDDPPADLDFSDLNAPTDLPVEVPSELVRTRPDVLASEAALHAATARLGVATANLLPHLTLTGSYGSESFTRRDFMHSPTTIWSAAGGLTQPIFEGGALLAQRRAASADLDAAYQRYQATVLRSFEEVADSLRALEADQDQWQERQDAANSAARFFQDTERRHASGSETRLAVVASEAAWQSERVNQISARSARMIDTAALCQAIGAPIESGQTAR